MRYLYINENGEIAMGKDPMPPAWFIQGAVTRIDMEKKKLLSYHGKAEKIPTLEELKNERRIGTS